MYTAIIISVLVAASHAQVFGRGKCPEVTVQQNFNITQYLGYWYEIYKYAAWFETGQKCIKAHYTPLANGHIKVDNVGIENDGTVAEAIGDATIPDPSVPAKIKVKFPSAPVAADYWVLDTDYKSYSLVYSCINLLGLEKIEFTWMLGRNKTFTDDTKNKLFKILEDYKVDTGKLIFEDQTCAS